MRGGAHGNLGDDLIGRRVEHLDGVDAGQGEIHAPAVGRDVEGPRRLVERYGSHARHGLQIEHDDGRLALLLRADPGAGAVRRNSPVVDLGRGHLTRHLVRRGVDDERAIGAKARHEHLPAVARHGKPMGIGTHVDGRGDLVRRGVDHAHRGSAVAADIDLASVRSDHEPVRSLGHG
jgi:hypothetical protein